MKKVLITNTTRRDFEQHMHHKFPKIIFVPKFALNQEEVFESEEEFALFEKLCAGKIASGEIVLGSTKNTEAEYKNEKVEAKETKAKQELNQIANAEFEKGVKAQLGDSGAEVKIKTDKSKKESK